MIELSRRPYAFGTSHRLDQIELERPDGTRITALFKDLRASELGEAARDIKPAFLDDPRREVQAYALLADADVGIPECYAAGEDWLTLELIDGVELWQVGEVETWIRVAGWLADFHARRFEIGETILLDYDREFFEIWPERAVAKYPQLRKKLGRYERVVDLLCGQPKTLIHGEFYASNVLVAGQRIAPVDWEMAGIGPAVIDVAALISGWDDPKRAAIVGGYGTVPPDALCAAELHLALQWLGWSSKWTPPSEHARDWMGDALAAVERLAL